MFEDLASGHYGNWVGVIAWIALYGAFLAFLPFYKKSQWKPTGAYLAFIVAFALEMFGLPFSMYVIAAVLGQYLPDGILWGHTLSQYIGHGGMYVAIVCFLAGGLLVFFGWREIHKRYWSHEAGTGELVSNGIYNYIRHPQYTGFLLVTFGMLCEWATLPMLLMWPVLVGLYYRLAKREEAEMEQEFGAAYALYRARTGMFLPRLGKAPAAAATAFKP
ncbi:MAG: methyltransferase family protein [Chloroflexota bacterium]